VGTHTQRTVEAWFKVDDKTRSHKQTIYEEGGTVRGLNIYIHTNGTLYGGAWNEPGGESNWAGHWIPWNNVQDNTWHHVAVTLNGGSSIGPDAVKMYVDGQLISTGSGSKLWQHVGDIKIGKNGDTKFHTGDDGGGESFYGDIDEVRIWNVERTASQIADAKDWILNGDETGLVAYYNFQENSGTIANDSQTLSNNDGTINNASWTSGPSLSDVAYSNSIPEATAQTVTGDEDATQTITLTGSDADGDALTYTLESGPSHGTIDQTGSNALDFDGNDDVYLGNNSSLNIRNNTTVMAWVKPNTYSGRQEIMINDDVWYWEIRANGNLNFERHGGTQVNCNNCLTHNEWQHIAIIRDGSNLRMYINAQEVASSSINGTFNNISYGYYIGQHGHDNTLHYSGAINEVSIWNRALSSTELQNFMNNALNGNESGLVGYWDCNEGSGTTVNDLSGNENDGTINGASWITQGTSDVITYTPNANYNGSDIFTFTVSDGQATSSAATVNVTVTAVNDVPVITSSPSLDVLEGSLYDYSISVNDIDGDAVVMILEQDEPDWLTISNNNSLSGTPGPLDGGLHNVVLTADDSHGGVITQSFTVAVSVTHLDIDGTSGFRILSSPISGAVYSDLLDELWTQGAVGSDHEGADPNIWTYNDGWNPVTNLNTDVLAAGQSFVIYVFSDTDWDGDDDLPVTISVDGTPDQTGVTVAANPSKWNLIGNPYGLHVDVSQMLSDNNTRLERHSVYTLDHSNPGYRTHNGTIGDPQDGLIKPFDGFWIQTGATGDNFEFTEQSIRRGQITGNGRTTNDDSNGSAVFTFTNGEYTRSTYLTFTPEGDIHLDPLDADRLLPLSPAEHLTSMIYESGKSLSINNLPSNLSDDVSFDMDVMLLSPSDDGYETQAGQVNLTWDITNLPEGMSLALVNNGTGQTINLYGYPSANINLPSKGGFSSPEDFMATYPFVGEAQFMLSVFSDLTATEEEIVPETITLHNAYPNPFNPSTMISFDLIESNKVSLNIFDLTGRQVASLINKVMIPGTHQISWNPGQVSSGVYLVKLIVGNTSLNQKITYIK